MYIDATEVEISDLEYERKGHFEKTGFKDLSSANEIAHSALLLSRLVADKKEMTMFGSDRIVQKRERHGDDREQTEIAEQHVD